jgi:glycosyltransferase involved in cell wall biosynthesis
MGHTPSLSAVISTRNRPDFIPAAVESVLANTHPSFELLVVDQSDDESTEAALERSRGDARFRYVHIDRVGLSTARNTGIEMAQAPIVAFTDDDCAVPSHWLASIESAFDRHPDVELLYGQTLAGPELDTAAGVIPTMRIRRERKLGKGHRFRTSGMGANFALRRSLVERVGGFDEVLGAGGPLRAAEDFDFQYRAYRGNAVYMLCPDVCVYHYGIRASQEWRDTLSAYGIGDGAFYLKHIRCGDFMALRLLLMRMGRLFARELRATVRGRPVQWTYLRSYLTGMRHSLQFGIDKDRRLYRPVGSR